MREVLIDLANIRFTQEHVYDSFNANSAKAGGVVELIENILAGRKTPRDLPLIRVAARKGAYWCVDNRRLFVYKHCQLGTIPVEVYDWKESREFELKWRNGMATRQQADGGRRVGVIQRTDVPFPRSAVMEPSMSQVSEFFDRDEQADHDRMIAKLRRRLGPDKDTGCAAASAAASAASLCDILGGKAPKGKKRRRKACQGKEGRGSGVEEVCALAGGDKATPSGGGEPQGVGALRAPRKKKRRKADDGSGGAAAAKRTVHAATTPACDQTPGGPVRVTVALAQEDSSDEEYAIELTAL